LPRRRPLPVEDQGAAIPEMAMGPPVDSAAVPGMGPVLAGTAMPGAAFRRAATRGAGLGRPPSPPRDRSRHAAQAASCRPRFPDGRRRPTRTAAGDVPRTWGVNPGAPPRAARACQSGALAARLEPPRRV